MNMFRINEVKSWAKKHGITVKKQGSGYVWYADDETPSEPEHIDHVAKAIFNRITGNKFVDYQNGFRNLGEVRFEQ